MMTGMFEGHHTSVLGTTQTGKTTFALLHLESSHRPVFFFNPQKVETPFVKVDKHWDIDHLIRLLKSGEKLDYVPSPFRNYAKLELNFIIQYLFCEDKFTKNKPLLFAIDECHDVARQCDNNEFICMIPCRGLSKGIHGVFIAQRPALMDKTLYTQSTKQVIFHTESADDRYFTTKGIDAAYVYSLLGNKPEDDHNYVIYERRNITGPYKEKI